MSYMLISKPTAELYQSKPHGTGIRIDTYISGMKLRVQSIFVKGVEPIQ